MNINININDILHTTDILAIISSQKFGTLTYDNKSININLLDVLLPFGCEKFNDKLILNIELENNNQNNNILSILSQIEENLKNQNIKSNHQTINNIRNKGFINIIKKSKLGNIIRTHLQNNTDIFIKKKNGEKITIDSPNLNNTSCNIDVVLQGFWINNNEYGMYIIVKSIEIIKFN